MSEINACFDSRYYSLRMKQRSNTMRYRDTPTNSWGLKDVATWNETCLLRVFCVDLWTWRCIASRLLLRRRLALVWSEPCKQRPILSMSGCFQQKIKTQGDRNSGLESARTEGKGAETSGPGENEPDTQSKPCWRGQRCQCYRIQKQWSQDPTAHLQLDSTCEWLGTQHGPNQLYKTTFCSNKFDLPTHLDILDL